MVVFALGSIGVGVGSASATLPEFNNRTGSTVKFSGDSNRAVVEYVNGAQYACTKTPVTGEVEPGKTKTLKNVVLTFKGCTGSFCSFTTTTKPLTGTLGYIKAARKEVGLLLKPSSGPVAECTAFPNKGTIVGSIILQIACLPR